MSNPQPAPTYQALYRACMKEAAGQGRILMQRLVKRAGEGLQRRGTLAADATERQQMTEAARTLMKHEAALCQAYPQALLAEFAQAIAGDSRNSGALSFDSLELMGDEQMRENVEMMRMQQAVTAQVEAELSELNALVSSVQGLESVQPDRNPLRPEVYVRSLRTVSLQSPIPSAMRARWMMQLSESLGPELARVYTELAGWMRSQGVTAARFSATQPASSSVLNLTELRKLLAGEFADSTRKPDDAPRTEFPPTLPAAFDALESLKQVDVVVQRAKARQATDPLAPAQMLAQEVVRLMLDNIAGDTRLLAPVRQCVRDLEPALMRLALDDPRFFSDREHPARSLLDEMTQRSLAWDSDQAPGFKSFIDPLLQAVEVLRTTHVPGAEPFDFALGMLREAWGDAHRQHQEKAVRALLQAEQRNLLAEKIAREMRNRPDLQTAPREVIAFVTGPWAQVMAQARLANTKGTYDPGGYTSVITDLVWSAQPRVVGRQTGRLLKLVPVLMEKLTSGLASIDYPQRAVQRFLDYLAHAHRIALHTVDGTDPSEPAALSHEEIEAMTHGGEHGTGAWLAPTEAQHSGFVDMQGHVRPPTQFAQTAHDAIEPAELPVADLQPGSWVEMLGADGWARFRVMWASPHGTLFMFFGAAGQPKSMTRTTLEKMLHDGTLRLVSAQAVVDGALDAVAQAALRNSLDAKSS